MSPTALMIACLAMSLATIGWDAGSSFQTQAAMRMLYYFPAQTKSLIARRLETLDVNLPPQTDDGFMLREVRNRVRTTNFIKAVAWCDEPEIREQLLRICRTSTDPEILLASLRGVGDKDSDLILARINTFIDQLPATEAGPFGTGYDLLVALGERLGERAKPTFTRYLQNASLQRWRSMCQVLRQTQTAWSVELLAPILKDKRRADGWTYAVDPTRNDPRLRIRLCDEAAETISLSRPELAFKMAGRHADLDRQIEAIRKLIAGPQH